MFKQILSANAKRITQWRVTRSCTRQLMELIITLDQTAFFGFSKYIDRIVSEMVTMHDTCTTQFYPKLYSPFSVTTKAAINCLTSVVVHLTVIVLLSNTIVTFFSQIFV